MAIAMAKLFIWSVSDLLPCSLRQCKRCRLVLNGGALGKIDGDTATASAFRDRPHPRPPSQTRETAASVGVGKAKGKLLLSFG